MFNSKKIIRLNKRNVDKFINDINLHQTENFIKNLSKVFYFGYKSNNKFIFGGIIDEYEEILEVSLLFSSYKKIEDDTYYQLIKEIKNINYQNINLVIYIKKDINKFLNIYKDKKILKNNLQLQKITTKLIVIAKINFIISK